MFVLELTLVGHLRLVNYRRHGSFVYAPQDIGRGSSALDAPLFNLYTIRAGESKNALITLLSVLLWSEQL